MSLRLRMNIKEGAVRGLCGKCQNAMIRQDFAKDPVVTCGAYYPSRDLDHAVDSCSSFEEKGQMSVNKYESIAWILEVKRGKPMGFKTPTEAKELKLVTE